jgi:hypothetical protein
MFMNGLHLAMTPLGVEHTAQEFYGASSEALHLAMTPLGG